MSFHVRLSRIGNEETGKHTIWKAYDTNAHKLDLCTTHPTLTQVIYCHLKAIRWRSLHCLSCTFSRQQRRYIAREIVSRFDCREQRFQYVFRPQASLYRRREG